MDLLSLGCARVKGCLEIVRHNKHHRHKTHTHRHVFVVVVIGFAVGHILYTKIYMYRCIYIYVYVFALILYSMLGVYKRL